MSTKSPYSIKRKVLIFFISMSCIVFGGKHLYLRYTNPVTTEISILDFENKKPGASWLKVTGGFYDIQNTIYKRTGSNLITKLYIPYVYNDNAKIHLLIETSDSEHIKFFSKSFTLLREVLENQNSENAKWFQARKEARKFFNENQKWFESINVEGTLRSNIERQSSIEKEIVSLTDRLAPNYAILKLNERPISFLASSFMVLLGIAILTFVVYRENRLDKSNITNK